MDSARIRVHAGVDVCTRPTIHHHLRVSHMHPPTRCRLHTTHMRPRATHRCLCASRMCLHPTSHHLRSSRMPTRSRPRPHATHRYHCVTPYRLCEIPCRRSEIHCWQMAAVGVHAQSLVTQSAIHSRPVHDSLSTLLYPSLPGPTPSSQEAHEGQCLQVGQGREGGMKKGLGALRQGELARGLRLKLEQGELVRGWGMGFI